LLAKVCWPQIDTQRTEFVLINSDVRYFNFPDFSGMKATYGTPGELYPLQIEQVELRRWVARGRRKRAMARWGYSAKLDIVVIRDARIERHLSFDE
jgi:hypothetical protein